MDVTISGDTILRPLNDSQLTRVQIQLAAFDGEIGAGAVPIDDPNADDEYFGGREFKIDEGTTLLIDGFIADQDRVRGPVPIIDREVVYGVQDPNALLFAKRAVRSQPAQDDDDRVLAFAALDLPGVDTTWVLNTNIVTMPAKRYDGEGWAELIQDVVDLTGKTIFIHDKAAGGRCLHYHRLTEGHTCGLTISDVATQSATVYNPWSPQKKTSPADLGNNLRFVDQAGRSATYTDATSITNHDADGLAHQKIIRVEAASQAHLDAIAAAQGSETKDERFTWITTIGPLDETALALIRVGDLITVTSQVMGLTAAVKRIAHMKLRLAIDDKGRAITGWWMAELELGAPVRRPFPGKSRSRTKTEMQAATAAAAAFPYCVMTYQRETFTRTVNGGLGNSEFSGGPAWGTAGAGATFDVNGTQAVMVADPTIPARAAVSLGFSGVLEILWKWTLEDDVLADGFAQCRFALYNGATIVASCDITQLTTGTTAVFTLYSAGVSDAQFSVIDNTFILGDPFWCRFLINGLVISGSIGEAPPTGSAWDGTDTAAGPISTPGTLDLMVDDGATLYVDDIAVLQGLPFDCLAIGSYSAAPVPGQEIEEDLGFGDGTNTSFTLDYPAAAGTLHVDVDGTDQTEAVTYSVGDTFYLSFAPEASERITVTYKKADA